jgi:hypothetical protein
MNVFDHGPVLLSDLAGKHLQRGTSDRCSFHASCYGSLEDPLGRSLVQRHIEWALAEHIGELAEHIEELVEHTGSALVEHIGIHLLVAV